MQCCQSLGFCPSSKMSVLRNGRAVYMQPRGGGGGGAKLGYGKRGGGGGGGGRKARPIVSHSYNMNYSLFWKLVGEKISEMEKGRVGGGGGGENDTRGETNLLFLLIQIL